MMSHFLSDNDFRLINFKRYWTELFLQVLDLSHCNLDDVSALNVLVTITYLNLSNNKLTSLPSLSTNAASTLKGLNMSANLLVQISGMKNISILI